MVKMTIKQCIYFMKVVEAGGIAQASRALTISQPAVAQAIDKLEELYDVKLFKRHHARGTELTQQGRSFLYHVRKLVEQAKQTEKAAYGISADKVGVIRLGFFHTLAPFYLPRIIRSYKTIYPDMEVEAFELQQEELVEYLAIDKIDLAITYDMSITNPDLEKRIIIELPTYILINREHQYASKKVIALQDLANEPFIMFEGPSSRDYFKGLLSRQGIFPKIAYNATSMQSVRSAVTNNLGYSIAVMVSENDKKNEESMVRAIPILENVGALPVVLISNKNIEKSGQYTQFADFCDCLFNTDDGG